MARIFHLPRQAPLVGGAVSPGAKAYFYLTGTSTPTDVYTTSDLDVAHDSPVVADGAGVFPAIYLDPEVVYKATVLNADDTLIYTDDPVEDGLTSAEVGRAIYPRTAAEISAGVTITDYSKEPGDVRRYGAVGDGVTDDTASIAACFACNNRIVFPDGQQYLMGTGVTKLGDNIEVDFGNATFINDGAAFLFTFGATADTPTYTGLEIKGGYFTQSNPSTTSNYNYIKIAATKDFKVSDVSISNFSNGGIYVEAGCEDGEISSITLTGSTGYSTCRGIWLNGGTASDYASQLVDISSIARNATVLPAYAVKNVKVTKISFFDDASYGVYLINTRDCSVTDSYIDIQDSGLRCVALNNYSPGARVIGNTFRSTSAGTGVLATQYSHDVLIENNSFLGSFGGGRDIYVAYLASALIQGNRFNTDSTQQIQIDMGATAVIQGNTFTASAYSASRRVVRLDTIENAVAGTSTYGDTATTLPGVVFQNNTVRTRLAVVRVFTPASNSGNIPGLDTVVVRDNVFYDFNNATQSDEYGLAIQASGTTYVVRYAYFNNVMYPSANALRNRPEILSGTGYINTRSDFQSAAFRIAVVSGVVTVTKLYGGDFSCAASRSSNNLIISPRTINGESGASVATPVGISDITGNAANYRMVRSSTNYVLTLLDSSLAAITLSSVDATVDVVIAGTAT